MLSFLLAVHFLLAILIIGLVLIQKHDSDGALGSVGGGGRTGMVFSARGQANLLTRSTAVLMTLFFINCLVMAKIVKHAPHKSPIIEQVDNESVLSNGSQALKDNRIRKIDAAKTTDVSESQKQEAPKTNTTPTSQKIKKATPFEKKK